MSAVATRSVRSARCSRPVGADTYAQFRAGQSFPIKNLADGVYYVRVLANPDNTLIESDTTNNESLRKVRIYTGPHGKRRVKVSQVGLVRRLHRHLRPPVTNDR